MDKDRLEAMSRLGIAASKAGESLRKVILAMEFWTKILGFKPEKTFEPKLAISKCYNCGNKTVERIDSPAWSQKYKCDACGYYSFIWCADFLSGALNENVAIDKRDSAMDG